MKIKQIMTQPVKTVSEATSLEEAARLMLDNGIGALPVVDPEDRVCGIVTESSFTAKSKGIPFSTFRAPQLLGTWISDAGVEEIYKAARDTSVKEIMTKDVITVDENDTVNRVVELMLEHDVNRIPVTLDGRLVGIVARHDLLRLLVEGS